MFNRREVLTGAGAAILGLAASPTPSAGAAGAKAKKRHILMFTKSSGYEHSAITREGDKLSFAERTVTDLGAKHDFDVTCTKDGGVFTPDNIAKYDAFFFYTTGDLTKVGEHGNPPMTPEGKAAFLEAIRKGKGFIGTHSASDSFHAEPDASDTPNRYAIHGGKADPYIRMLGGEFIKHGPQQVAKMRVTDTGFPGCKDLRDSFDLNEEWYSLKDFSHDLHVLLVQETAGMKGNCYQRAPFPATWARMHGKGRVFYTSMGHREDVWTNPIFQGILLGGIAWATGNAKADVSPNIESVAPGYAEIPPMG